MSYTLEQRLAIGKEIYDGELTRYEAAKNMIFVKKVHVDTCDCIAIQISCCQNAQRIKDV